MEHQDFLETWSRQENFKL